MSAGSVVIFDCNNSFNVKEYGIQALKNIFLALIRPHKILSFSLVRGAAKTRVKILNPIQLSQLLKKSGFKDIEFIYLDYSSGVQASWYSGQIVAIVK